MNHETKYPNNVVRAWMDTVLLPILGRIELDIQYLRVKNWTWQYYPEGFEYLKPIAEYVEGQAGLNLRQMLEVEGGISVHLEKRDRALWTLQCACSVESGKYRESDALQKTIAVLLEESGEDLGPRIASGWEGNLQWRDEDYIIQYLVNNRADLPSYYVLSRFWLSCREELFSLIEGEPDLHAAKARTIQAGESLLHLERELHEHLWQQINDWSFSYNLPITSSTT